jgi:hypothetical protein
MQMSGKTHSNGPSEVVTRTVHTAWDRFLMGDLKSALSLLHSVTSRAQDYSTYHLVLASTLLSMQENGAARLAAERTLELSPESSHAKLIAEIALERLEAGRIHRSEPQVPTREGTLAAFLDPIEQEPAQNFNLNRTADELTRERPLVKPAPEPEHIQTAQLPDEESPGLVSETLAEIMIRQGKLTDAKKVYIQLSRIQPDRYAHFKSKIEAIDKLLLGTSIAPEKTDNDPVA